MRIQLNKCTIDHRQVKDLFEPPHPWYRDEHPDQGYRQIYQGAVIWMGTEYRHPNFIFHEDELVLVKLSPVDSKVLYVYSNGKFLGVPKPVWRVDGLDNYLFNISGGRTNRLYF